jgi:septation ring formation regulator EzrA
MKKEKWYLMLSLVVILISAASIGAILSRKNLEIIELESQIDNLSTESFINASEIGRYDLALDSLKIVNPKAEKQFQNILNSGQYE